MIENPKILDGAIIKKIISYTDDDVGEDSSYHDEHHVFKLIIETDRGIFVYEGCNDWGPQIKINNKIFFEL